MQFQGEVQREEVLWLLGSLCGLFRVPFDTSLIVQDYPPLYSLKTVHEAAGALGVGTKGICDKCFPNRLVNSDSISAWAGGREAGRKTRPRQRLDKKASGSEWNEKHENAIRKN